MMHSSIVEPYCILGQCYDILVSGQDFPSQPSGWAVIIIHYVIILDERYSAIVVPFSLMNWNILCSLAKSRKLSRF